MEQHGAAARLYACAGGEWFCGTEVASIAWMGTTGDLQPDPMPAPERVRNGAKDQVRRDGGYRVRHR